MRRRLRRWLPAVAALVFAGFAVPAVAVQPSARQQVFAFQDVRIKESSGLVDLGSLMVTTNDSGDSARVFVVDPADGRTVGVTTFGDDDPVDVEALAPAGGSRVWVGDIGDNDSSRDDVRVYRVPVGPRAIDDPDPESYVLRYPDGAHDAESLLAPAGGRLYVITKSFAGGSVYRTPLRLSRTRPNVLEKVAKVDDYATDAALLRDGTHVVVRSLGQASVYTFPGFEVVSRFGLPAQRQGEGVSVGPGGRTRLSSEGLGAPVLEIALPALPPATSAAAATAVPPAEVPRPRRVGYDGSTVLGWAVATIAGLVAVGVGIGLRRRG